MRSCRAQTACRCTNTRARVGLAPVQRVTAPRADARSVRNHRDRHTCHIPVGPLLRGPGERCAKRVRQTPTHPQQRPCPPFRRTGNTLWNNKSHDPSWSCSSPAGSPISVRHSERHNCATSDMRSNSRKLRRQKECRSQIGTRRMSDRDCRSDSSRPHLLTARTHGGVVSVTSRRGVSARCLRGLMLALGSPIVKPVRAKSSGSSQGHSQHTARFQRFRALKPRHQQLHALRVPWTLGYARSPLRLW